jgi:WD40 repeat protein
MAGFPLTGGISMRSALFFAATVACLLNFAPAGRGQERLTRPGSAELPALTAQTGHGARAITAAVVSPDGRFLATGASDGAVKLWDVETGLELQTWKDLAEPVTALTFDSGRRLLAAAAGLRTVLWKVDSGESAGSTRMKGPVSALAFNPTSALLALGWGDRSDGGLTLWDLKARKEAGVLPTGEAVLAVAFGPDGKQAATCGVRGGLRLWEVEARKLLWESKGGRWTAVAFPADGRSLTAAGAEDGLCTFAVDGGVRGRIRPAASG